MAVRFESTKPQATVVEAAVVVVEVVSKGAVATMNSKAEEEEATAGIIVSWACSGYTIFELLLMITHRGWRRRRLLARWRFVFPATLLSTNQADFLNRLRSWRWRRLGWPARRRPARRLLRWRRWLCTPRRLPAGQLSGRSVGFPTRAMRYPPMQRSLFGGRTPTG